jgi:5,10-methylene-tetrahydrofolate dehydrogenase/methenyl tetrahydrofolate cyclohydrolase
MQKILNVYYDNPNTASDMYLKYLSLDCEKNDIKVKVFDNLEDWYNKGIGATLILKPTIADMSYDELSDENMDNPSATATGIYEYITKMYPHRSKVIGIIGRGNVGRELLDMLIDYGYTVVEMNSQTDSLTKDWLINCCDVLIGVSSQDDILKKQQCDYLIDIKGCIFIDASNNFPTTKKLRCGKWTRQVIIDRINKFYDYIEDDGDC